MNKISIFFIAAFINATSASASSFPEEYTLYCKGEKSTGLNWRDKNWQEQRFYPEDYIFAKLKTNLCMELMFNKPKKSYLTEEVCINIRVVGSKYNPGSSGKCLEYTAPNGAKWSDYIECEGFFTGLFYAKMDGWFHKSTVHSDLDNVKNDKDSMLTEVGKCSQIK